MRSSALQSTHARATKSTTFASSSIAALSTLALTTCTPGPSFADRAGAQQALAAVSVSARQAGDAAAESAESSQSTPRTWRYRVHAGPEARELRVEVELPPGVPETLGVDAFADPFLGELELATKKGWRPLLRSGRRWRAPVCREHGCSLRYRYRLGAAAERIDRFAYAGFRAGALMAPPSTFLLAPQEYVGPDRYSLDVSTAPGESFVTGVWRERGSAAYSALASVLFQSPYSAFGRFVRASIALPDGRIELAIAPGEPALGAPLAVAKPALERALSRAAAAVTRYYGRFPVPEATVIVVPSHGAEIQGMQLGNGGASIVLFVGSEVDEAYLARDWVITHELLHLGFPTLEREHLWLAEGLATYQEPLVRARAGLLGESELWRGFMAGFPKGLPTPADGGLDGSPRWERTYWGGALVFLMLDVELRSRSEGRLSLDSAARAILTAGGDTSVRWSLQETLGAGDTALDRPSLAAAYDRFAAAPVQIDLQGLSKRLGVRVDGDRVTFDDGAELAQIRRALVEQPEVRAGFRPL
jgi:hypothetical protein